MTNLHGLLAEFEVIEDFRTAAHKTFDAGFRDFEVYSPFPDERILEKIGLAPSRIPALTLSGGLIGGLLGYVMQYYTAVLQYPINVGGRPLHSWQAFVPVTFECCVLGAALVTFVGFFTLNRMPQFYQPVFHLDSFAHASDDRFFVLIRATDPLFEQTRTRLLLKSFKAKEVHDVPV